MKAELRSILSEEIENIWTFSPDPEQPFCFTVVLIISTPGAEGEDWFSVTVLNTLYLESICREGRYFRAYACLVMERFDFPIFEKYVTDFISHRSGETWQELAHSITQLASWEFDSQVVSRGD